MGISLALARRKPTQRTKICTSNLPDRWAIFLGQSFLLPSTFKTVAVYRSRARSYFIALLTSQEPGAFSRSSNFHHSIIQFKFGTPLEDSVMLRLPLEVFLALARSKSSRRTQIKLATHQTVGVFSQIRASHCHLLWIKLYDLPIRSSSQAFSTFKIPGSVLPVSAFLPVSAISPSQQFSSLQQISPHRLSKRTRQRNGSFWLYYNILRTF